MSEALKKQDTGVSNSSKASGPGQNMPGGADNVIVMEKEFRSKKCHTGNITHLAKISDTEFLSCSDDMSFKVWDRILQGCSYTYETHEQLHFMKQTGKNMEYMVSSLGNGNLFIMDLRNKNQTDIYEEAHDEKIIQIITLSRDVEQLRNKYFVTRCLDGDIGIWSSTDHPDRVFKMYNIDKDDQLTNLETTARESIKEEDLPPIKNDEEEEPAVDEDGEPVEEKSNDEEEEEGEPELDDEGNPILKPKKTVEIVIPKKDRSNITASERDCMIEIEFDAGTIIIPSSFILCFSNYNESFVKVAIIDLKTKRKNVVKTFKTSCRPTKLYQAGINDMLIGTEGGKIEHWNIEKEQCENIYDAHPESAEGISQILEIKSTSELLIGEPLEEFKKEFKLLATASFGAKEFRLWKLRKSTVSLFPYLKIETTIDGGIEFLLETTDTQLVAANSKCIKFYDFIDKQKKESEDSTKKAQNELNEKVKNLFCKIDTEEAWKLNKVMLKDYFLMLFQEIGDQFRHAAEVSDECYDDVWHEMDYKETGFISWHQVKDFCARVEVHEAELAEERRIAEEIRAAKEEEMRLKREAEEAARLEEEERIRREEEEGIDQ